MVAKEERLQSVPLAMIELYLLVGKPIAPQTLKDERSYLVYKRGIAWEPSIVEIIQHEW